MSFYARLIHSLTLMTPTTNGLDADGDSAAGPPVETPIRCNIQPKTAREIADSRSAGTELSDHVIFALLDPYPTTGSWYQVDPDDDASDRYDIAGVREFRFGRSPHLEIDARLVRANELVAAGS